MEELNMTEVERRCAGKQTFALFVYTPMCGTCKLAERMLEVTHEALPTAPLYKINLNTAAPLAEKWQITSVPALIIFNRGEIQETHYAMQSVGFLFEVLQPLI
ncbi:MULTISPECIES: thioredoxin family protein [Brevibacillus]|uniref:Thioredoxin n=1 Tax=Brevibacillus invocatus TaxID=173959 RepID=A0A3M8CNV7_9BACL|nr:MULTISPECIES: thioredoxin family protein [Brevibacillus]MCM3080956.1 thioredoxin family protein [Brevibacillus invocatus]MCM3431192.1 thioredoxin family protein [Brevibacillus invocatus]MDH4618453.1 thioredoxin family protein [Brevibacillus sp. AY1]RNB76565.1 thioredoxin [Brevibacillus invocatus]